MAIEKSHEAVGWVRGSRLNASQSFATLCCGFEAKAKPLAARRHGLRADPPGRLQRIRSRDLAEVNLLEWDVALLVRVQAGTGEVLQRAYPSLLLYPTHQDKPWPLWQKQLLSPYFVLSGAAAPDGWGRVASKVKHLLNGSAGGGTVPKLAPPACQGVDGFDPYVLRNGSDCVDLECE